MDSDTQTFGSGGTSWSVKNDTQGRNHDENLGATAPMVGRICPPWLE